MFHKYNLFNSRLVWNSMLFPDNSYHELWVTAIIYILSEVKSLSRVRLFATPWTEAYQAPPSLGFSRQEYWSGVPLYFQNKNIKVKKEKCT